MHTNVGVSEAQWDMKVGIELPNHNLGTVQSVIDASSACWRAHARVAARVALSPRRRDRWGYALCVRGSGLGPMH
eukprot:COSAG06_NODE_2826_length_6217_cov_2.431840_6_plen_75_part_00